MAFDKKSSLAQGSRLVREDEDSQFSRHSTSRLEKKANLELVWQKANSINGIRKLNMHFKEERRSLQYLDASGYITNEYWQICDTFCQMMEVKQLENLKLLTKDSQEQERIYENIKSEINTYQHSAIGLGRRMPVPSDLDVS